MKRIVQIFFIITPLFIIGQNPTFEAKADTNKLQLGEEFSVNYELTLSATIDPKTIDFPNLSDSLGNNWELRKVNPIENSSININGDLFMKISQEIIIANFDSGKYELPPKIGTIGRDSIYSNTLILEVNPVAVKNNNEIKDIKNIKEDPFTFWENILLKLKAIFQWILENWIIIISIIAGTILAIYVFYRLKNKNVIETKADSTPTPIKLLNKLKEIENDKLWQNGKYKLYFSEIDAILWEFIEFKYKIPTFEKTSKEILDELRLTSILQEDISLLKKLFNISNMVKFAKQTPNQQENEFAMKFTRSFIEKEINSEIISEE